MSQYCIAQAKVIFSSLLTEHGHPTNRVQFFSITIILSCLSKKQRFHEEQIEPNWQIRLDKIKIKFSGPNLPNECSSNCKVAIVQFLSSDDTNTKKCHYNFGRSPCLSPFYFPSISVQSPFGSTCPAGCLQLMQQTRWSERQSLPRRYWHVYIHVLGSYPLALIGG